MAIRSDITIDWESSPRVITVAAPSVEITIQDLVDTCRDHEDRPVNMDRPILIDAAGKEPLGGIVYVGVTATLQNAVIAFEARGGPTWILCKISGGNVVAVDDVGADIDPRLPTAYVTVDRTASSSATLLEQEAIEFASYNNGVTIDITSIYSGTSFPVGTPRQPVNNLTDAILIATERGLEIFYVHGNLTIDSGSDVSDTHFIGHSMYHTTLTVAAAANTLGTEFLDATVTGALDGDNYFKGCRITGLTGFSGVVVNCMLAAGDIVLAGGVRSHFLDCWSGVPGVGTPVIDLGGSGQGLGIRDYNGGIKLINKSGAESVSLDINSGNVILDSTITNGTIVVRGVSMLTDNSVGATVVADDLMNSATIKKSVWDEDKSLHVIVGSLGKAIGDMEIDLNTPDQYKADVSGVAPAGEYDTELAAIQADLDDPNQYKADVTALALEVTLQLVKTETDKIPSLETVLTLISDIEGGRWRITGNQMIFYKDDNTTEVARFNLFDAAGDPAEEDVFERQRV